MGSIPTPGSYGCIPVVFDFLWHLKKKGYKESILIGYSKIFRALAKRIDLDIPEELVTYLATADISECRKELIVNCYDNYCLYRGLQWDKPRYKRTLKLPFIPMDEEIKFRAVLAELGLCPN